MIKRLSRLMTGLLLVGLSIFVIASCGGNNVGTQESGVIAVSPSQVTFALVEIGSTGERSLTIYNDAQNETLRIFQFDLVARDGGRVDELSISGLPELPAEIEAGEELNLTVNYTPTESGGANRGEIRILSSDPRFSEEDPLVVLVDTLSNEAQLFVDPPQVRFPRSQPGQSAEQTTRVTNVGSAPLKIYGEPIYSGGADFRISTPDRTYPLELKPYDSDGALASPQDYVLEITTTYRPLGGGDDSGQIQIESNDRSNDHPTNDDRGLSEIPVLADADAACIEVDSRIRNFGQVPIGQSAVDRVELKNCGTRALVIDSVFFEDSNPVFSLELGAWDSTGDGFVDEPVTLQPGQSDAFNIRFVPLEELTERVTVIVGSNDPVQPELRLDVTARGAEGTCPTAAALASVVGVGTPRASITAVPLQDVVLDGRSSSDEDGEVVTWDWEILERPPGTNVALQPTQSDPNDQDQSRRQFTPLTAGEYRFGLTVVDNSGFQSCNQAEVTVTAIPDQNIHIELTWTNPADPDETDDFGSDLDLHLTKMGPGKWFDAPYSVYFLNQNQDENPIWNPEDPSLDIDVLDGAGPENITMASPDDCQWYAVGVHYYEERFATAYATVRIYINAALVYERPFFPMQNTRNFWDVARIHWDSTTSNATIVEVDGFYPVEPAGQDPVVTSDMSDVGNELGLCTAQGLY